MNYLKNDICSLTLLNGVNFSLNKKVNILSTSFFKMNNHYKNFNIYIRGLKSWIRFLNSFENNYVLRIFIDDNVRKDRNIMNIMNSSKKIQLILFSCDNYKNGKYHKDVFGTLLRFFPLFDFENNDSNNVIVVDIDLHEEDKARCKFFMQTKLDNFTAMAAITPLLYENKKAYVFAGLMSVKDKYDKNILLKFIKNAHNIKDKGFYNKRETTFGFGVDEIFINNYLLPNVKKYSSIIEYNISYFLFHSKKRIMKSKNSEIIFKSIIGKYYKEGMSVEDMYNFIDSKTYMVKERNEIINYLTKRFNKVISYLYKNKTKWIELNIINILEENLKNIIYGFVIITSDSKKSFVNYEIKNLIEIK